MLDVALPDVGKAHARVVEDFLRALGRPLGQGDQRPGEKLDLRERKIVRERDIRILSARCSSTARSATA